MLLAYELLPSDNAAYFFEDAPQSLFCPECDSCLDYDYVPQNIKLHPSKKYDVSATYDGRTLYSEKFVDFCKTELGCDEEFVPLQGGGMTLYYMLPKHVIEYNLIEGEAREKGYCSICGEHNSRVKTFLTFNISQFLSTGFYRSDLTFGSNRSKSHLTLVSIDWYTKLKAKKFRGLYFDPIFSSKEEELMYSKNNSN